MTETEAEFVDGGEFYCYEHEFKASTKQEWQVHLIDSGHTETGTTPCVYCGQITRGTFDIMPDMKLNAVCQYCGPKNDVPANGVRTIL